MRDDAPTAYGRLAIGEGAILLTIKCPLCGKRHTHGWSVDCGYRPGHRVAHCSFPPYPDGYEKGYNVAPAAGEVERISGKVAYPVTADDVLVVGGMTVYMRDGHNPRVVADYVVDSVWPTGLVLMRGGRRFIPLFLRTHGYADRAIAVASTKPFTTQVPS